jgi:hypothetical protein
MNVYWVVSLLLIGYAAVRIAGVVARYRPEPRPRCKICNAVGHAGLTECELCEREFCRLCERFRLDMGLYVCADCFHSH